MKKIIMFMICLATVFSLFTACGKNAVPSETQPYTEEEKTELSFPTVKKAEELKKKKAGKIDIDLATEDSDANYNNLVRTLLTKEECVGKTVLLKGKMLTYPSRADGEYIFTCDVENKSGNVSQNLEFKLADSYKYPDDYPAEGETVTICGTFEIYLGDGSEFCRLKDAYFAE